MLPINKFTFNLCVSDLAVRQRMMETPLSLDRGLCGFNHVHHSMPKTAPPRAKPLSKRSGVFLWLRPLCPPG